MKDTEAKMNTNSKINLSVTGLPERVESILIYSYAILIYVVLPAFIAWAMSVAIDAN